MEQSKIIDTLEMYHIRTHWYVQFARGFIVPHNTTGKVQTLSTIRLPEFIALYASAPNHVLGQ